MSPFGRNRGEKYDDWDSEFSSFASLLFKYIGMQNIERYREKKYDSISKLKGYIGGKYHRYQYYDRCSKLSFLDIKVNQLVMLNFHCDKCIVDLKFLDVAEEFIKQRGAISSTQLKKMTKMMTKLQYGNSRKQLNEFFSHHKPLVSAVASRVEKTLFFDKRFEITFRKVSYSKTFKKLVKQRNILYGKIADDIRNIVSKSVEFDTADTNGADAIKKEAQLLFLSLVRERITSNAQFLFKCNGINITGFSDCKACIQTDCEFDDERVSMIEKLLRAHIIELQTFHSLTKVDPVEEKPVEEPAKDDNAVEKLQSNAQETERANRQITQRANPQANRQVVQQTDYQQNQVYVIDRDPILDPLLNPLIDPVTNPMLNPLAWYFH